MSTVSGTYLKTGHPVGPDNVACAYKIIFLISQLQDLQMSNNNPTIHEKINHEREICWTNGTGSLRNK